MLERHARAQGAMSMMEPGESYDIEIAIPSDHIPGTNWYHPHAHGSADVQIASGAVGALIIEGDFAENPEIAAAKERLLVLPRACSPLEWWKISERLSRKPPRAS